MIGVALIEYLLPLGCLITGIVRPHSVHKSRLPKHSNLTIIEEEIKVTPQMVEILGAGYDVFYHLSWANTGSARDTDTLGQVDNIKMTLEALNLCSVIGCTTFVGAGSQAEFGPKTTGPIGKNSTENPNTAYGICKFAAGKLVMAKSAELGVRCIWTRIFSVFGPHDRDSSLISYVIKTLKEGKNLFLTTGTQTWDYLYSADAAKALYLIGEKGNDGKIYCIGSGIGRPLHEYIDFIKSQIRSAAKINYGAIPFKKNSVMYLVADIQELSGDTGFYPDYSFEDGIRKLLEYNF